MLHSLVGRPLVRRLADSYLNLYARRRVARLNRRSAVELQRTTLLQLIGHAQETRFGREHGFAEIRGIEDYQRRVPPRDYEAFWKDYWEPAFPFVDNVTWPGRVPYFALSSGTTSGTTKYIPVSSQMLASNRRAGMTILAFFLAAYPRIPLFSGHVFFLGGSTDLQDLSQKAHREGTDATASCGQSKSRVLAGDLSGIAALEFPDLFRPYTFPPLEIALLKDWETKMRLLAEHSSSLPITAIGGVPSWLLVLFEKLQKVTGKQHIAEIWPTLRLVIHGGTSFQPYRRLFQNLIGNDAVHYLETYAASEGFVATEDPRYHLLRLVPDNGLFFEFVPVEDLGKDRPARHTIQDLEPGVQYAVMVTTCAGLWSYMIGDTICFERREPPLFRFTGRTKFFLSAFGEHLISEEIERAVTQAAEATGCNVVDFHVGPVFPESPRVPGRHRYLIEFAHPPADLAVFGRQLDLGLCRINEDYQAHRSGDLTMLPPEVHLVPRGGFAAWMRSQGKLGGQHKVPRMDNTGKLTEELSCWLQGSCGPSVP
jgi:hypothetical protein